MLSDAKTEGEGAVGLQVLGRGVQSNDGEGVSGASEEKPTSCTEIGHSIRDRERPGG